MNYQTEQAKLSYRLASTNKKGCQKMAKELNLQLDSSLSVSEMREQLREAILPNIYIHKN